MEALRKLLNNHTMLIVGGVCSILLLFIFIGLQGGKSDFLKLETRWLIVSGVPLLFVLIVGGYIKSFKGFGIELESQLNNPVKNTSLLISDVIEELPGDEKKSYKYLDHISQKTREKIERLSFNCGQKEYYKQTVIKDYLRAMPNINYLEFVLKNGQFFCLLPINIIKMKREIRNNDSDEQFNSDAIQDLIDSINDDNLLTVFGAEAITEKVEETKSIIEMLPIVRKSKHGVVGVVNENQKLVGIIDKTTLESNIADEVLLAGRKK